MDGKEASEIYDYIEENQDTNFSVIAEHLKITEQEARTYSLWWATYQRGEFIFKLSKQEEHGS